VCNTKFTKPSEVLPTVFADMVYWRQHATAFPFTQNKDIRHCPDIRAKSKPSLGVGQADAADEQAERLSRFRVPWFTLRPFVHKRALLHSKPIHRGILRSRPSLDAATRRDKRRGSRAASADCL
jgi:hypothetical protein